MMLFFILGRMVDATRSNREIRLTQSSVRVMGRIGQTLPTLIHHQIQVTRATVVCVLFEMSRR